MAVTKVSAAMIIGAPDSNRFILAPPSLWRSSDAIVPGGELMRLQHVFGRLGHDIAELAAIGRNDLDHAIDHLLGVEMTIGRVEERIELFAQGRPLGNVLRVVEPAEWRIGHRLIIAGIEGAR